MLLTTTKAGERKVWHESSLFVVGVRSVSCWDQHSKYTFIHVGFAGGPLTHALNSYYYYYYPTVLSFTTNLLQIKYKNSLPSNVSFTASHPAAADLIEGHTPHHKPAQNPNLHPHLHTSYLLPLPILTHQNQYPLVYLCSKYILRSGL